ncbi:hypothetical protein FNV43_RR18776 [Rhamnella rubrinervis]|uniref:EamA domain-containing protein n=1 Tax=Rhamnella rubrinervis TaxID=2594499 RepID=A0A8K0DZM5_9ROSA|nr:hypothetical protein FNV43_RR18776 [Rhamnella rubrinervis]
MKNLKPVILMVVVEALYAGQNVLYKMAMYDGISTKIMIAYRYVFASAITIPLAFILERKNRPKLTWMIFFQGFLSGIFGASLGQNLFAESLVLTNSVTFVSAMSNLIPAFVLILGVTFGLEKLEIGTMHGKAMLMGVIVSIGGAMIFIFYKGLEIHVWSTVIDLLQKYKSSRAHQVMNKGGHHNQGLGSFLAIACSLSLTIWYIIQNKMSKNYPSYSSTALMCLCAFVQATLYALCAEKDWSKWNLGWNIELLTVVYSGFLTSGMCIAIMAWCSKKKGALFVSSFYPLLLMFGAIAGSLFLDEHLYLGSIIGGILIILGLYGVLWGKDKELEEMSTRRMEKLEIGTYAGKAKVVGVIVSIGGTMIFTFCKGSEIKILSTSINLLQKYDQNPTTMHHSSQRLGSFLSIASSLSFTICLLLQTKLSENYPPYTATALMCVFASIQSTIYAMFAERDWSRWKLGWNIRLLTVLYAGIFPSGVCVAAQAWCLKVKGAVFICAFYPLVLVFVAIVGSLFLDEHLHLGSLVGALFIILGLYGVLWGKSMELKETSKMVSSKGSRELTPTEATSIGSINHDEVQSTGVITLVETDQPIVAN